VEETSCRCAARLDSVTPGSVRTTTYERQRITGIRYPGRYLKETSKGADV